MPRKFSFPHLPFINSSPKSSPTSSSPPHSRRPSQSPSSSSSSQPSLYQRRTQSISSRGRRSSNSPRAPTQLLVDLPSSSFSTSHGISFEGETDQECWERMLILQKEFHCYKSARMEAAIEALENGINAEEVMAPSRFCLDLLNEQLRVELSAMP